MTRGPSNLPRVGALKHPEARIECLAYYAHDALITTESLAWALIRWPDLASDLRRGFTQALEEEQGQCRMYLDRLTELGGVFREPPYSNDFWKLAATISASPHGPSAFLAAIGLTREQANLDSTVTVRNAFAAAGDHKSAEVFNRAREEKIRHVALAAHWIKLLGPPGTDLLEAYSEALPLPLSAARAKGATFDAGARRRAGLGQAFIEYVRNAELPQNGQRGRAQKRTRTTPPKGSPLLYPNLGGEELPGKGGVVMTSATTPTLRLWRLLFGPGARFLPALAQKEAGDVASKLNIPWWPQALGPPASTPAFSWLEGCEGIVPWIATARLSLHPSLDHERISSPAAGIVARVHDKAFALAVSRDENLLPEGLRELFLVLDPQLLLSGDPAIEQMQAQVASWPGELGHNFTLKPRLGTSGRGRVPGVDGCVDSQAVRGALKRLAKRGGAVLEPWFKRKLDLSAQMHVSSDGQVTLLGTMEQIVAPSGVYLGHRAEFDSRGRVFSGGRYEEALREAGAIAGKRAFAEGFHGPCGIDAFTLDLPDADGNAAEVLRPIVEFNARFTMGTIAIGLVRRALDRAKEALELGPGERRAFYFGLDAPAGGWSAAYENTCGRKLLIPLWHEDDEVQPALLFAETRSALDDLVARAHKPRKRRPSPDKSRSA
ncbi:MAG: ferritin-like domain-containing protein [bacterium]|nr:ferritin-like domain-containing protein [bacterium]